MFKCISLAAVRYALLLNYSGSCNNNNNNSRNKIFILSGFLIWLKSYYHIVLTNNANKFNIYNIDIGNDENDKSDHEHTVYNQSTVAITI